MNRIGDGIRQPGNSSYMNRLDSQARTTTEKVTRVIGELIGHGIQVAMGLAITVGGWHLFSVAGQYKGTPHVFLLASAVGLTALGGLYLLSSFFRLADRCTNWN